MNRHFKIRSLLTATGFSAIASLASAQSGLNAFALSLSDLPVPSVQTDSMFAFAELPIESGTSIDLDHPVFSLNDSDNQSRDSLRGLRAMGAGNSGQMGFTQHGLQPMHEYMPKEDPLTVVPLPSAAIAGFGLLVGFAGVRVLRKAKA